MTGTDPAVEALLQPVREFYRRADGGDPALRELFTADAEFYFPKHGIGAGPDAFMAFLGGFGTQVSQIAHDVEGQSYLISGNHVVVEGTTSGRLHSGQSWSGGVTPGGRFCSVFRIEDGLIARMYVYLDPDYVGRDTAGFAWDGLAGRRW